MRKILIFFLIFLILALGFSFTNVQSLKLENYIQRQIEGYLSRVLPSNSYFITVSVGANINRTQEVKNETIDNYSKEESITPPEPPKPVNDQKEENEFEILPGLEKLYNKNYNNNRNNNPIIIPNQIPAKNFKEEENRTSREYDYIDQLQINEVSVQIAFDSSLNQDLVQSVKNIISSKFDATYGDKANVIYSTVNLSQPRDTQNIPETIPSSPSTESFQSLTTEDSSRQTDLENNLSTSREREEGGFLYYLDKYNSLVYLLVSIIVFIIILLLFIFFAWLFLRMFSKKEEKTERIIEQTMEKKNDYDPIPLNLHDYEDQEPIEQEYEVLNARQKEEHFLDNFLKEPLLSRKYFLSLTEDDKNELLSAFVSTATKGVFRDIAGDQSLGSENFLGNDFDNIEVERARDKIFRKHIDGINQYIKIYGPQMRDVFSKLSFFTEDEIKTLYSSMGVASAAIIAKNVDSQKVVPYLNQLTELKRKDFLREFNNERELSQDEMDEFKRKLKLKTDELAKNIFIRKADNKFVKRKLLESSIDKKKFLETIKEDDPDFYNEFRSYTVDFRDLLLDDSALFNRVVQSAENEDITLALIGIKDEAVRNRVLSSLPQIRRDFIEGFIASRRSSATKDEITAAQNRLLDIYRSLII